MIEPTQQAWKEYANRLREHYVRRAKDYPQRRDFFGQESYSQAVRRWRDFSYMTEPMAPGQECDQHKIEEQ